VTRPKADRPAVDPSRLLAAIEREDWPAARIAGTELLRAIPGARRPSLTGDRLAWLGDQLRDLAADVEAVGARDVQGRARLRSQQLETRKQYDAERERRAAEVVVSDAEAEQGMIAHLAEMAEARRVRLLEAVAAAVAARSAR
jgi:hypothetical protein